MTAQNRQPQVPSASLRDSSSTAFGAGARQTPLRMTSKIEADSSAALRNDKQKQIPFGNDKQKAWGA